MNKDLMKQLTGAPKILRTHIYIMNPAEYEIRCPICGCENIDYSEFEDHIWCYECQEDYLLRLKDSGVFNCPVPELASEILGISFDRVSIDGSERVSRKKDFEKFQTTWVRDKSLIEYENNLNKL